MKRTTKTLCALLMALVMIFSFVACGNNNANNAAANTNNAANTKEPEKFELKSQGQMKIEYAKRFSIELFEGGYRMITAGTGGYKYLVVPQGKPLPGEGDVDAKTIVLQLPITKVYMCSTGMESLVDAIGALLVSSQRHRRHGKRQDQVRRQVLRA